MIGYGELKLSGTLVHPLQALPDGTHDCPLERRFYSRGSSLALRSLLAEKNLSLLTRGLDTLRHPRVLARLARFWPSRSKPTRGKRDRVILKNSRWLTFTSTRVLALGRGWSYVRPRAIARVHAIVSPRRSTDERTVILARTYGIPSGTRAYTHTRARAQCHTVTNLAC